MTDRNARRRKVGQFVSTLSALDPDWYGEPAVNTLGSRVLIPALIDDTVHSIVRLVRQAGGEAVVAAVDDTDREYVYLRTARITMRETHETASDWHVLVRPEVTLAMMFEIVTNIVMPGVEITMRLEGDELSVDDPAERPVTGEQAADLVAV